MILAAGCQWTHASVTEAIVDGQRPIRAVFGARYTARQHILQRSPAQLQFPCVPLNFPHGGGDFVHVFFIAQQRELRDPVRLPGGAVGYGEVRDSSSDGLRPPAPSRLRKAPLVNRSSACTGG